VHGRRGDEGTDREVKGEPVGDAQERAGDEAEASAAQRAEAGLDADLFGASGHGFVGDRDDKRSTCAAGSVKREPWWGPATALGCQAMSGWLV